MSDAVSGQEAAHKTTPPDVLIGQDGYLFLSGGAHRTRELFSGVTPPSAASVQNFNENIDHRARFCQKNGIAFLQVVFPDKMVALADMLDLPEQMSSTYQRDYAVAATSEAQKQVVYPLKLLMGQKPLFYQTDTHYSALGSLVVSQEICRLLADGLADSLEAMTKVYRITEDDFSGDLGSKFTPPLGERTHRVHSISTADAIRASNGGRQGNDGLMVLHENLSSVSDKTLLIFGDSFMSALLPFMTHVFRRVIFCRTRYFHTELVAAISPDVIFCGMAERYLSACQRDLQRPHFLSFTFANGRGFEPTEKFSTLWGKMIDNTKLLGSWDF